METRGTIEGAQNQRREDLLKAISQLASVEELPDGRVDQLPEAKAVLGAADELARLSELEATLDSIDAAAAGLSPAAQLVVTFAKLRADDRLILGHGDEALRLRRIDFKGTEAAIPELEARLRPSGDGSMWLVGERPGERQSVVFAGEFQLIVGGEAETVQGLERQLEALNTTRGREDYGLSGQLLVTYAVGVGLRAMWGSGLATITDQRLLGVVFDDDMQGRPRTPETAWMPPASVASDASSVIAFEIPRAAIEEVEVIDGGFIGRRIPYANLHGENFGVSCQTVRVVDGERLVKPKKDVLSRALRSLA